MQSCGVPKRTLISTVRERFSTEFQSDYNMCINPYTDTVEDTVKSLLFSLPTAAQHAPLSFLKMLHVRQFQRNQDAQVICVCARYKGIAVFLMHAVQSIGHLKVV